MSPSCGQTPAGADVGVCSRVYGRFSDYQAFFVCLFFLQIFEADEEMYQHQS